MEMENEIKEHEDDVPLPGFRFHPTDEELVGFYLRRKVEKKPIRIELIKQTDIYKYDPWDLPKSSNVGDKEWYFYCRRGRKYRNSIRPNRVTCSGFWKATGIDKPIYSSSSGSRDCIIGLKKSLVYYRGSAGKGTKTDWMMHEFRLPATHDDKSIKNMDTKTIAQEAEVWTLCRIIKRNVSYRKCISDLREVAAARKRSSSASTINNPPVIIHDHTRCTTTSNKTCSSSMDSSDHHINTQSCSNYISFSSPLLINDDKKSYPAGHVESNANNQQFLDHLALGSSSVLSQANSSFSSSISSGVDINYDFLRHANWEDFQSIVQDYGASLATNHYNPFYL